MTLFLLLAIVSTSSSTLIQVTFDQSGLPRIDAESDRPVVRSHVVHLGYNGYTTTSDNAFGTNPVGVIDVRVRNIRVRIPTINSEPITGVRHRESVSSSIIGIGTGSDLLVLGGPIDFVRQSNVGGFLRLGGSEENFITNNCLPNSIMRMQTVLAVQDLISNYIPRVETRISVSIGENVVATNSMSFMDSEKFVLITPHSWLIDIYSVLPRTGDRFGYRTVFIDCARTMQRLPVITLRFTAGGLRLLPEDYTRPTGREDTCELLIGGLPVWAADQTIRFNPLLIPGINARAAGNEIILCDSSANL